MQCDRPGCKRETTGDLLYCSERCFNLDNDPTPITVLAANKAGGFGLGLERQERQPVILPKNRACAAWDADYTPSGWSPVMLEAIRRAYEIGELPCPYGVDACTTADGHWYHGDCEADAKRRRAAT